jgi:hypothetical protein
MRETHTLKSVSKAVPQKVIMTHVHNMRRMRASGFDTTFASIGLSDGCKTVPTWTRWAADPKNAQPPQLCTCMRFSCIDGNEGKAVVGYQVPIVNPSQRTYSIPTFLLNSLGLPLVGMPLSQRGRVYSS